MKKILFTLLLLTFIPMFCFGMSTGWDGIDTAHYPDTCVVWRSDSGKPNTPGQGTYWCNGEFDQTRRIYELELAVTALETKVNACNNSNLELRVKALEDSFSNLQNQIMSSLRNIVIILTARK